MKAKLAKALVRWVSRWIEASYNAYCRKEQDKVPNWWPDPWAWGGRQAQKIAFPIAHRLDKEAMTDQMIEECWWG